MSVCKACGAPMLWAKTTAGMPIPLDPEPHPEGNITVRDGITTIYPRPLGPLATGEPTYRSHFVTCPQATEFRRRTSHRASAPAQSDQKGHQP